MKTINSRKIPPLLYLDNSTKFKPFIWALTTNLNKTFNANVTNIYHCSILFNSCVFIDGASIRNRPHRPTWYFATTIKIFTNRSVIFFPMVSLFFLLFFFFFFPFFFLLHTFIKLIFNNINNKTSKNRNKLQRRNYFKNRDK